MENPSENNNRKVPDKFNKCPVVAMEFVGIIGKLKSIRSGFPAFVPSDWIPIPGAKKLILDLRSAGYYVLIPTVLVNEESDPDQVGQSLSGWFRTFGIPFDGIHLSVGKPVAVHYLNWPEDIKSAAIIDKLTPVLA